MTFAVMRNEGYGNHLCDPELREGSQLLGDKAHIQWQRDRDLPFVTYHAHETKGRFGMALLGCLFQKRYIQRVALEAFYRICPLEERYEQIGYTHLFLQVGGQ